MTTAKRAPACLAGWAGVFLAGVFNGGDIFWALYWLAWFFIVFLVPELYWVVVNSKYTVSEETWRFESLARNHPFEFEHWTAIHWAFAVAYFLFMFMLGLHLVFGFKLFFGVYG